jgi:hypothetical protein
VAVAVAFIRMGIAGRRETLNWATLHLANALAPVRPTDAELDKSLASLRERQLWLGGRKPACKGCRLPLKHIARDHVKTRERSGTGTWAPRYKPFIRSLAGASGGRPFSGRSR